jgi:hypothetical protein
MQPRVEWQAIEGEPATTQSLFLGYAAPLALIPAIAAILGSLVSALIFHSVLGLVGGLISAVVVAILSFVIGLGGVFVFGLIINALASSFGAAGNALQSMKVAVYGMTAAWVAGILGFIPLLGSLVSLVGFGYSCYLIYLGIVQLMKPPADKAVAYAVVSIVIYVVIFAVLLWIVAIITAILFTMLAVTGATTAVTATTAAVH